MNGFKAWSKEKVEELKRLSKDKRPCEIVTIMGLKKNSILGKLYRLKVSEGYTPPSDSKYAKPRRRPRMSERIIVGKRKCNTCENEFEFYSSYQRFCVPCKETINSHGYGNYPI
jgi:hypothetical protein|tara:strand:+ start:37 stop:378 length:342 start_codon:yes stop_codon:yes gene_type:complete